jgi:hypothetical protein
MNNWNKTGKIKAIILGLIGLPNLFVPVVSQGQERLSMVLVPLVFGSLAIPLIAKFNEKVLKRELTKPTWNDNPLNLRRPLSFFHYAAFFFMTVGLSMIIGTAIGHQDLSYLGLTSVSFGLGILMGIWLTLKWTPAKG